MKNTHIHVSNNRGTLEKAIMIATACANTRGHWLCFNEIPVKNESILAKQVYVLRAAA